MLRAAGPGLLPLPRRGGRRGWGNGTVRTPTLRALEEVVKPLRPPAQCVNPFVSMSARVVPTLVWLVRLASRGTVTDTKGRLLPPLNATPDVTASSVRKARN